MTPRAALVVFLVLLFPASSFAEGAHPFHDAVVHLHPDRELLTVRDAITVQGAGEVAFRLHPHMEIESLTIDGSEAEPGETLDLGAEGEHVIRLSYRARLPLFPRDPARARRVDMAAGPEGVFLSSGADWLARIGDGPFRYNIVAAALNPYVVVMPGRLSDEARGPIAYQARFETEHPTHDAPLMAGRWTVGERKLGDVLLRTYFDASIAELSQGYLDDVAGYIERYSKEIGPYPFSAFHVASGPLPVGIGYPGMTYVGTAVLRLPFIRKTSLPHEVLHAWWGNGVWVNYRKGNWSEGLTTYMADYAMADGRDKKREKRLAWLRDFAALPKARDFAARRFTAKAHDASQVVGYGKVAFIFHMLRRELGEKLFAKGVKTLWRTGKFKSVSWTGVRKAFERGANRDLGWFFDQWVKRRGAPKLRLVRAARGGKGYQGYHLVDLTLAQDRPAYSLSVPVAIRTEKGVERHRLPLSGTENRFRLAATAKPLEVAIDPDFHLFRRLDPAEAPPILRDVTLGANTAVVVLGADKPARALAQAILDGTPDFTDTVPDDGPLLVVGLEDKVGAFLKDNALPPTPSNLAGKGTARVWTARFGDERALLAISARDAKSLAALRRPLPHYGRKSYLAFEGAKAIEKGVWASSGGPLRARLD